MIYGIWLEKDGEWWTNFRSDRVYHTENLNLACAQILSLINRNCGRYQCARGLIDDAPDDAPWYDVPSIRVIGPIGKPQPLSIPPDTEAEINDATEKAIARKVLQAS